MLSARIVSGTANSMLTALFSVTFIIPTIWLGYTLRVWFVARREWSHLPPDAKAFYLLVAPPITFVLDVVLLADRLFYRPSKQGRNLVLIKTCATALALSAGAYAALAAEARGEDQAVLSSDANVSETAGKEQSPRAYLSPSQATAMRYRESPLQASSDAEDIESDH